MNILLLAFLLFSSSAFAIEGSTELVSVPTGSAVEIGSSIGRVALTAINTDGTNPICCGYNASQTCSGGSGTDGQRIAAGAGYTWDTCDKGPGMGSCVAEQPIYCRASGGAVSVTYDQVRR